MSKSDVERLFGDVMTQTPANRLKLAASILEAGRPDLVRIALDIVKTATDEVNLRLLGHLTRHPLARPAGEERKEGSRG